MSRQPPQRLTRRATARPRLRHKEGRVTRWLYKLRTQRFAAQDLRRGFGQRPLHERIVPPVDPAKEGELIREFRDLLALALVGLVVLAGIIGPRLWGG